MVDDEKLFNGAMVLQKELMRKMCVFLIPVYILILCLTNKHIDIFVWWCAMEFFFPKRCALVLVKVGLSCSGVLMVRVDSILALKRMCARVVSRFQFHSIVLQNAVWGFNEPDTLMDLMYLSVSVNDCLSPPVALLCTG